VNILDITSTKSESFNSKKNLFALCLSSFTVTLGFGVIMPFFPLYADEILSEFMIFNITIGIALQIGVLTSAFMFMRFLLAPAFGGLSDSSGRKPIILVGMTVYAFLIIGYGLAYDLLSLLVLRTLQGLASAAVWPIGEALIVDTSTQKTAGRNLGYYMMSMQGGMASGPFIGAMFYIALNGIGKLPPELAYRLTFISQGVMGIAAAFIVAILVKDPNHSDDIPILTYFSTAIREMSSKTLHSPKYLVQSFLTKNDYRDFNLYTIYIVAIINGFGNALIFPLITLFLDDIYLLEPDLIAIIIGIVGLLALSGNPLGGYLSDKVGRKSVTWVSGLLRGITYLFIGFNWGLLAVVIIFATQRFLWSIFQPSFRAMQSDFVPEEVRGKEFGTVQSLFNLGSTIGPIIGGAIYDAFLLVEFNIGDIIYYGVGFSFACAGIISVISSFFLLIFIKPKKQEQTRKKTFSIN
jgi:DHA1 family multidrug resistance protein-like MFS transporter